MMFDSEDYPGRHKQPLKGIFISVVVGLLLWLATALIALYLTGKL